MKTKLAALTAALTLAAIGTVAQAGPDLDQLNLRKNIADANRPAAASRPAPSVTYIPSSTGKGGSVVARPSTQGSHNIALLKPHKMSGCCEKC